MYVARIGTRLNFAVTIGSTYLLAQVIAAKQIAITTLFNIWQLSERHAPA